MTTCNPLHLLTTTSATTSPLICLMWCMQVVSGDFRKRLLDYIAPEDLFHEYGGTSTGSLTDDIGPWETWDAQQIATATAAAGAAGIDDSPQSALAAAEQLNLSSCQPASKHPVKQPQQTDHPLAHNDMLDAGLGMSDSRTAAPFGEDLVPHSPNSLVPKRRAAHKLQTEHQQQQQHIQQEGDMKDILQHRVQLLHQQQLLLHEQAVRRQQQLLQEQLDSRQSLATQSSLGSFHSCDDIISIRLDKDTNSAASNVHNQHHDLGSSFTSLQSGEYAGAGGFVTPRASFADPGTASHFSIGDPDDVDLVTGQQRGLLCGLGAKLRGRYRKGFRRRVRGTAGGGDTDDPMYTQLPAITDDGDWSSMEGVSDHELPSRHGSLNARVPSGSQKVSDAKHRLPDHPDVDALYGSVPAATTAYQIRAQAAAASKWRKDTGPLHNLLSRTARTDPLLQHDADEGYAVKHMACCCVM